MQKIYKEISKRKYVLLTVIFIIVGALNIFYSFRSGKNEVIGYVSTELTSICAEETGKIVQMLAQEGQEVPDNSLLFVQETDAEVSQMAILNSELEKSIADYEDLLTGSRPPDIAEIVAERDRAKTQLKFAKKRLNRAITLRKSDVISVQELENAQEDVAIAVAQLKQVQNKLKAAKLPARKDRIKSAAWAVEMLKGKVADVQRKIDKAKILAPANGRVTEVLYNQGTIVNAGDPVLKFLDWTKVYVVIYLSPKQINDISIGDAVTFKLENNNKKYKAKIAYISQNAEFSPPVLYTENQESQLLFKVKAYVDIETAKVLPLGLPVNVTLKD